MAQRTDISFTSRGTLCRGWWYDAGSTKKAPCIILAHGFGATKELRLDAYAERFAAAGFHAMVFDYRHFGTSEGTPRQLLVVRQLLEDWSSALAFVRTLPQVDTRRIALWGTSFSGGHVLATAVRDGNVAAVISQVPYMESTGVTGGCGFRHNMRLAFASLHDLLHAVTGREPYRIAAIGEPGDLAVMAAPGEMKAMMRLVPQGMKMVNSVSARIVLSLPFYRPGRLARKLNAPWLVQTAKGDLTISPETAAKAARRAPQGELIEYDISHFEIYVQPVFERAVSDQVSFLRRQFDHIER